MFNLARKKGENLKTRLYDLNYQANYTKQA